MAKTRAKRRTIKCDLNGTGRISRRRRRRRRLRRGVENTRALGNPRSS